jgi:hypothetical protein
VVISKWAFSTYGYMGNAISKGELHDDGKKVTLHYKIGGSVTCNIRDLFKDKHEKTLLETFCEPFLFPVSHKGKTLYFHGQGQESIKNGEVFRAVINGKALKL